MPSKKQYNLVQNDDYDTRIPLHSEEAFHHGITFQAKYIGTLDVPRPTSRVEIVAAMRRIRYEFKTKGIKKKKVTIEVSVDGVKVVRRKKKKKKHWTADDGKLVLLSHPIYRIFYVSHDSQDLKIFSYIARDGASNVFKCAVFKSTKKSQAMRVVRTIGQAFEVCHKLSINAPENENCDQDEQDTLTQDLLSDNLSDVNSDKPKKDIISEVASDKMSILPDDASLKDGCCDKNAHIEMLPPPPVSTNTRKSPIIFAETYASPHSDGLNSGSGGSGSGSLPPAGSALSTHHELQLVREQLDQQCQQTQAAMAQLQLAREQLAAEQMARIEAQSRAHQLLVQNRELLDHIAALVAHLQGGEKTSQQQNSPHVAMPQQQQTGQSENYTDKEIPPSPMHQFSSYSPQGLIENRAVTSCLSGSPLVGNLPSSGNIFNFPYASPVDLLSGYSPYPFSYSQQNLPLLYTQQLLNNNNNNNNQYTLQNNNPAYNVRHSYPDTRISPGRKSEPPQVQSTQKSSQQYQSQQNLAPTQTRITNGNRQGSVPPETNNNREAHFIKPLSQIGTLTTTDIDGRVRVIVPVPSNSNENSASNLLANLRISDDMRKFSGAGNITRSTSEKVPNRSELMSQVQRQAWSRHTTN